jgi:hypothetical protein
MTENEKLPSNPNPVHSKKQIREEVFAKLNEALANYKNGSPEKEFSHSIKKASKLLAKDFAKSEKKTASKKKKPHKVPASKRTKVKQA